MAGKHYSPKRSQLEAWPSSFWPENYLFQHKRLMKHGGGNIMMWVCSAASGPGWLAITDENINSAEKKCNVAAKVGHTSSWTHRFRYLCNNIHLRVDNFPINVHKLYFCLIFLVWFHYLVLGFEFKSDNIWHFHKLTHSTEYIQYFVPLVYKIQECIHLKMKVYSKILLNDHIFNSSTQIRKYIFCWVVHMVTNGNWKTYSINKKPTFLIESLSIDFEPCKNKCIKSS